MNLICVGKVKEHTHTVGGQKKISQSFLSLNGEAYPKGNVEKIVVLV